MITKSDEHNALALAIVLVYNGATYIEGPRPGLSFLPVAAQVDTISDVNTRKYGVSLAASMVRRTL